MMFMGVEMDIQKEKEAFEAWFLNKYQYSAEYFQITKFDADRGFYTAIDHYNPDSVNSAWVLRSSFDSWQAAKAQAVPEWISTSDRMPKEGEEVLVHSLGQVRQVTRDSKWAGGFKERNCYGWQAAYGQSHWMPKSIGLPEEYHFYYKNDAKQKAMIEAQEQSHD